MQKRSAYRLIAFDLDGTLTASHTPIENDNLLFLYTLSQKYALLILSAASCHRIFRQTRHFPAADLLGNYGLEKGKVDPYGDLVCTEQCAETRDVSAVNAFFDALRRKHGYTNYRGDSVLFTKTGLIGFPLLGTTAGVADKQSFDRDGAKRALLLPEIRAHFPSDTVLVSGTNSVDIIPHPHSKLYALRAFCAEHGYKSEEVLFCGDEYKDGGNDAGVAHSEFGFVPVDDYRLLPSLLAFLL